MHDDGGGPQGRPPLLLLHGAGGNRLHWPPQIRRLPGARIYALDLPAHGESGGRPEATISGYAERVVDWMREVGVERAVLAGHSMGAAIALTIALRLPRNVAGLVLIGVSARLTVDPEILRLSASRASYPQAVERVVAAAFSATAEAGLVQQALERMQDCPAQVFHADFRACDGFDVRRRLSEIEPRSLVLWGRDDRLTPPDRCRALAEGLPQAASCELADAGHMVMLERPREVAARIKDFLAQGEPW